MLTAIGQDFGTAIRALKEGKKCNRQGDGERRFVFLRPADKININVVISNIKSLPKCVKESLVKVEERKAVEDRGIEEINFDAYLCFRQADNSIVNGWVPTQADMLAEDWFIYD